MSIIENKIKSLNIKLPEPKAPVGAYVATKIVGKLLYISGQISIDENAKLITGKVGKDFSLEEAYDAARRVGVTILSVIKNDIGFEKVQKVVKILGLVNCTEDFLLHPKVINGCSDLFVEYFGQEKGTHARSAMGVYVLPNNIPVEIEAIVELI